MPNATDQIAVQDFPQAEVRSIRYFEHAEDEGAYLAYVYPFGIESVGITGEELYPALSYDDLNFINRLNDARQGYGAY
jgi:hypothetical protein